MNFEWVSDDGRVDELARRIDSVPVVALDMEADAFHCYRPKICLVQLAWRSGDEIVVAIVDSLAVTREALRRLCSPFEGADPPRVLLHGGAFDVSMFKRDLDIGLGAIFDTEMAARLLGYEKTGLSAMAEVVTGSRLDKGARKTDWSRRPLSDRSLDYAARDVAVLLELMDRLTDELASKGRSEWAEQEFARIEAAPCAAAGVRPADTVIEKLKGTSSLVPIEMGRLRALVEWREREAFERDVPAAWLVEPSLLVTLARRAPTNERELSRLGMRRDQVGRHGGSLLRALECAEPIAAKVKKSRSSNDRGGRPLTRGEQSLYRVLRESRNEVAEALGLDPGLVCPGDALKCIARRRAVDGEVLLECGMRPWQVERLSEKFADAAGRDAAWTTPEE